MDKSLFDDENLFLTGAFALIGMMVSVAGITLIAIMVLVSWLS